ncbi:MAG: aminoacyl-tRNA hydrolase [Planctomycetes bacterium]|nr:aminoacyl-tRNA hydrolase [Planctomycetota bacterium]
MKLVVGLGNPGSEYAGTRHNVGFDVLDRLALEGKLLFHPARKLEGHAGGAPFEFARHASGALLVKPLTYMNRSGAVVSELLASQSAAPEEVLVVTDDFDLPLGGLRIRPHGGPGTHNGMRSIVESLASDRFPRLRVGIGRAGTDAARHVLERFAGSELEEIAICVVQAAEAIEAWLREGDLERVMTRFHSRWN